jgi:hypothetical protein
MNYGRIPPSLAVSVSAQAPSIHFLPARLDVGKVVALEAVGPT